MNRNLPIRVSYALMAAALVLVGWLNLTVLLLTALIGHFAMEKLEFGGRKAVSVGLFILLVLGVGYGFFSFSHKAVVAIPAIAEKSIPVILEFAEKQGMQLPFTDFASLKVEALDFVQREISNIGKSAGAILRHAVAFLIGAVVAISLFLNTRMEPDFDPEVGRDNLYSRTFLEIVERFRIFYKSFKTVMGAQIIISLINAILTAVFLVWNEFPYAVVLAGLTFLFGLVPIVGNLASNTLIVSVGITISPHMALMALVFLIVVHKLEYFLNSKIIGDRIKNPMWLTLLGLVVGEKLMGIPGMILAPVLLHYIKVEASRNRVATEEG